MNIHAMREKIAQAIAHEEVTGTLARTIAQVLMMHGTVALPDEIGKTAAFVKSYIESVPDLIERFADAAERIGAENQIMPILQAAEHYFFAPFDVIADQLGLVGLLDDAYYAQSLLQMIFSTLEERTGLSLIGEDLTQANALARQLIGEPQATMLDTGIAQALQQADRPERLSGTHGLARWGSRTEAPVAAEDTGGFRTKSRRGSQPSGA